jgi:hypothetical protein
MLVCKTRDDFRREANDFEVFPDSIEPCFDFHFKNVLVRLRNQSILQG